MNEQRWARALRDAREFRIPSRLFSNQTRQVFNFVELQYARYPFDSVYLPLKGEMYESDSHDFRFTGAIFRREGDVHALYTRAIMKGVPFVLSAWIELDRSPARFEVSGDVPMELEDAATWWSGFVSLCHVLDEMSASRKMVDVKITDRAGVPFANRQTARSAERDGNVVREIVLCPGATLRGVLREVRAARRAMVRSHPRRHHVVGHTRRYHTREGVVVRSLEPFERGGKRGAGTPYRVAE